MCLRVMLGAGERIEQPIDRLAKVVRVLAVEKKTPLAVIVRDRDRALLSRRRDHRFQRRGIERSARLEEEPPRAVLAKCAIGIGYRRRAVAHEVGQLHLIEGNGRELPFQKAALLAQRIPTAPQHPPGAERPDQFQPVLK